MEYIQRIAYLHIHVHKVSRDTYNRRGMSNMQLNDGPHGAWVGACRTSSAREVGKPFVFKGMEIFDSWASLFPPWVEGGCKYMYNVMYMYIW